MDGGLISRDADCPSLRDDVSGFLSGSSGSTSISSILEEFEMTSSVPISLASCQKSLRFLSTKHANVVHERCGKDLPFSSQYSFTPL